MIHDLLCFELVKNLAQLCLAERGPDQEKLFMKMHSKLEDGLDPVREELVLSQAFENWPGLSEPSQKSHQPKNRIHTMNDASELLRQYGNRKELVLYEGSFERAFCPFCSSQNIEPADGPDLRFVCQDCHQIFSLSDLNFTVIQQAQFLVKIAGRLLAGIDFKKKEEIIEKLIEKALSLLQTKPAGKGKKKKREQTKAEESQDLMRLNALARAFHVKLILLEKQGRDKKALLQAKNWLNHQKKLAGSLSDPDTAFLLALAYFELGKLQQKLQQTQSLKNLEQSLALLEQVFKESQKENRPFEQSLQPLYKLKKMELLEMLIEETIRQDQLEKAEIYLNLLAKSQTDSLSENSFATGEELDFHHRKVEELSRAYKEACSYLRGNLGKLQKRIAQEKRAFADGIWQMDKEQIDYDDRFWFADYWQQLGDLVRSQESFCWLLLQKEQSPKKEEMDKEKISELLDEALHTFSQMLYEPEVLELKTISQDLHAYGHDLSTLHATLGRLYEQRHDFSQAQNFYHQSLQDLALNLKEPEDFDDLHSVTVGYEEVFQFYKRTKQPQKQLEILDSLLEIAAKLSTIAESHWLGEERGKGIAASLHLIFSYERAKVLLELNQAEQALEMLNSAKAFYLENKERLVLIETSFTVNKSRELFVRINQEIKKIETAQND